MVVIAFLVYSAVILYKAFYRTKTEKRRPLSFRILMSCFAVVPWIGLLIGSRRIMVLIIVLLMSIRIISVFYCNVVLKEKYKIIEYLIYLDSVFLVACSLNYYTFADRPTDIHFGIPSVVISVFVGIVVLTLIIRKSTKNNTRLTFNDFGKTLLAIVISFFVVWMVVCNLNFALDFSKPEKYNLTIVDKYENSQRIAKTIKHNNIIVVELSGSAVEMSVSSAEYENYSIGDYVTLDKYKGFFNAPYFVIE